MYFVKDSIFNQKFAFETGVIDIKKYFKYYANLLTPMELCQQGNCKHGEDDSNDDSCDNDKFYLNFMGITREELKELKKRTSVDHLTCEGEVEPISHEFFRKFNEDNIKCKPVTKENEPQNLISLIKKKEMIDVNKSYLSRPFFKYCNYEWTVPTDKQPRTKLEFNSEEFSTLVACVKIYHPFLSNRFKTIRLKLSQEIHILGNQTVADLRDKIICTLDYIGYKDESNDCFLKDVGLTFTAKDEYPSSFIFIENTFYNDTRRSDLIDLSRELREWAAVKNLGTFTTASMENVKICDLKLKIGRPYVFQHQGNCEHLVVFSDVRFLELTDYSKLSLYPRIYATGRVYGKHCMMCSDFYAKWLVVKSDRLTHDKTYLCKKCFISYNYINGKKIGDFEAYKYVQMVALL